MAMGNGESQNSLLRQSVKVAKPYDPVYVQEIDFDSYEAKRYPSIPPVQISGFLNEVSVVVLIERNLHLEE